MRLTADYLKWELNDCTDGSFSSLPWQVVTPGKLVRADTQVGSYNVELQPDHLRLTFSSGSSEARICPTKFRAINRAQWEADDHHRRVLAQRQQPARMKPPKW